MNLGQYIRELNKIKKEHGSKIPIAQYNPVNWEFVLVEKPPEYRAPDLNVPVALDALEKTTDENYKFVLIGGY